MSVSSVACPLSVWQPHAGLSAVTSQSTLGHVTVLARSRHTTRTESHPTVCARSRHRACARSRHMPNTSFGPAPPPVVHLATKSRTSSSPERVSTTTPSRALPSSRI
eukprot:2444271-Rhodomonas_salina.1